MVTYIKGLSDGPPCLYTQPAGCCRKADGTGGWFRQLHAVFCIPEGVLLAWEGQALLLISLHLKNDTEQVAQ